MKSVFELLFGPLIRSIFAPFLWIDKQTQRGVDWISHFAMQQFDLKLSEIRYRYFAFCAIIMLAHNLSVHVPIKNWFSVIGDCFQFYADFFYGREIIRRLDEKGEQQGRVNLEGSMHGLLSLFVGVFCKVTQALSWGTISISVAVIPLGITVHVDISWLLISLFVDINWLILCYSRFTPYTPPPIKHSVPMNALPSSV